MKRTTIVNILLVFTGLFAGLVFSSLRQCTDEVMRQGIALQRLLTYHFLQDAESNTVTIYHGSEIHDQTWKIDGWTIVLRSLKQISTIKIGNPNLYSGPKKGVQSEDLEKLAS